MLKYSEYLESYKDGSGKLQRDISDRLVNKLKANNFDVGRFAHIMKDLELEEHCIDMVLHSLGVDADYENVDKFEILYYIANGKVRRFYNIHRRYKVRRYYDIHRYYLEEYTPEYVLNELEQADRFCEFMNSEE